MSDNANGLLGNLARATYDNGSPWPSGTSAPQTEVVALRNFEVYDEASIEDNWQGTPTISRDAYLTVAAVDADQQETTYLWAVTLAEALTFLARNQTFALATP